MQANVALVDQSELPTLDRRPRRQFELPTLDVAPTPAQEALIEDRDNMADAEPEVVEEMVADGWAQERSEKATLTLESPEPQEVTITIAAPQSLRGLRMRDSDAPPVPPPAKSSILLHNRQVL